jgi:hypothetical protein
VNLPLFGKEISLPLPSHCFDAVKKLMDGDIRNLPGRNGNPPAYALSCKATVISNKVNRYLIGYLVRVTSDAN